MVLGFKPQFVQAILWGRKIHTIREDRHERWKIGMLINMATGVRTKQYNEFILRVCRRIQRIEIWHSRDKCLVYHQLPKSHLSDGPCVVVDGKLLSEAKTKELAFNDGFEDVESFYAWFLPLIQKQIASGSNGIQCYSARLIHWTDLKY